MAALDRLALGFDTELHAERPRQAERQRPGMPVAGTDRQVAGRAFLEGVLHHGTIRELIFVVRDKAGLQAARDLLADHPALRGGKRARIVSEAELLATPTPVLHLPGLLEPRLVWGRTAGPGLVGTLTAPPAGPSLTQALQLLALAPTDAGDALVCTASALRNVVRTQLDHWADYLRDRFGGEPAARLRLEVIPPCVDVATYKPATPEDRRTARQALGVRPDAVAVLCHGPLSLHLRASPAPVVLAVSEAARQAGKPVHLLLTGSVASETVLRAVADSVRIFGPNLSVGIVDQPGYWHAADLLAVGGDSPHDSAAVTILLAQAHGLPVVAADWAGAGEFVRDDVTGFVIPTSLVAGASGTATTRLLLGETAYDPFLGEIVQTVVADGVRFRAALARLLADGDLRQRFGAAGRQFVTERHAPAVVVRQYETLWAELATAPGATRSATVPAVEQLFAGLATSVLDGATRVQVVPGNEPRLYKLQTTPATSFAEGRRCTDLAILKDVLATARTATEIAALDAIFARAQVPHAVGRATVAWLLKYGVIRVATEAGA